LGILSRRIASRDPTSRFSLVIEYKGVPEDKNKLGLFLAPSMYKIIAEYFVKWALPRFFACLVLKRLYYSVTRIRLLSIFSHWVLLLCKQLPQIYIAVIPA